MSSRGFILDVAIILSEQILGNSNSSEIFGLFQNLWSFRISSKYKSCSSCWNLSPSIFIQNFRARKGPLLSNQVEWVWICLNSFEDLKDGGACPSPSVSASAFFSLAELGGHLSMLHAPSIKMARPEVSHATVFFTLASHSDSMPPPSIFSDVGHATPSRWSYCRFALGPPSVYPVSASLPLRCSEVTLPYDRSRQSPTWANHRAPLCLAAAMAHFSRARAAPWFRARARTASPYAWVDPVWSPSCRRTVERPRYLPKSRYWAPSHRRSSP
jgi:hypothetical protein